MDAETEQFILQAVVTEQLNRACGYFLEGGSEAVAWFVFAFATAAFLSPEKSRGVSCVAFKVPRREPQLTILVVVE